MVSVTLCVEGGGNRSGDQALRHAFRTSSENAGLRGRLPRIVAGRSRENTYKVFCAGSVTCRMKTYTPHEKIGPLPRRSQGEAQGPQSVERPTWER